MFICWNIFHFQKYACSNRETYSCLKITDFVQFNDITPLWIARFIFVSQKMCQWFTAHKAYILLFKAISILLLNLKDCFLPFSVEMASKTGCGSFSRGIEKSISWHFPQVCVSDTWQNFRNNVLKIVQHRSKLMNIITHPLGETILECTTAQSWYYKQRTDPSPGTLVSHVASQATPQLPHHTSIVYVSFNVIARCEHFLFHTFVFALRHISYTG